MYRWGVHVLLSPKFTETKDFGVSRICVLVDIHHGGCCFFLSRKILQNSSKIGRMKRFYQSTFVGFKRITTVRQESIEHFLNRSWVPNNNRFQYRNTDPQGFRLRYLSICLQRQACVWLVDHLIFTPSCLWTVWRWWTFF